MLPPKGTLSLALSLAGTGAHTGHVESCPDINGPGCAAMAVPDEWHDLSLFFGELRLHADYGLTRWLAADLSWSLRVVHVGFQLEDAVTRQPIVPPFGPDLHHRTETLVGLTDPWLSMRAAKRVGPWAFVFRAGLTLPVGATVPNPFALGRQGLVHEHIQFGSGTVDPLAGVELRRAVGRFSVAGWMLAKSSFYENSHHYQAGSQLLAGANGSSDLWLRRWWFMLGALVYDEAAERWDGVTETEGNLGRTDVMLDTAISWRFSGRWSATLSARIPVWSRAVGAQLSTPAIGELAIARSFDLTKR
ncbi:MAG: hypothetical protein JWM53_6481 [bacterium]|nr:hypothetical protein [bacterium]